MEAKKSPSCAIISADVRAALHKDEKQNEVLSGEYNKILRLGRVISFLGRRQFNKIPLSMQELERKRLRDTARHEAHQALSAAARNRSPDPQRTDPDAAVSPGYYQVDLALVHAQTPGPMFMRPLTAPASPKPRSPQHSPKGSVPALDLIIALPNSLPGPAELLRRFTIRERAEQEAEEGGAPAPAPSPRVLLPSRRSIARSATELLLGRRSIVRSASQLLLSMRTAASQAHASSIASTSPMSLPSSPKVAAAQTIPTLAPLSDLLISVVVHTPPPSLTPRTPEQPLPATTAPQLPTSFHPGQLTALLQPPPSSPHRPSDARPAVPLPPPSLPDADPPLPQSLRSDRAYPGLLSVSIPLSPPGQQPQPSPLSPLSPSSQQAAGALRTRPHTAGKSLVLLLSSSGTATPSPPTTPRASSVGVFPDATLSRTTSQRQLRPTPSPILSPKDVRLGAGSSGASPSEHTASSLMAAGAQDQAPKAAASSPRTMERTATNAAAAAVQPPPSRDRARAQVHKAPKLLPAVPAPRVLELVFET